LRPGHALLAGIVGLALISGCASAGNDEAATPKTKAGSKDCQGVDLAKPPAQAVPIRIGHGLAAEEPFWLMSVDDSVAPNKNKWYTMELKPFRGTAERLTAYQAKELDAVVISPQAQIRGTARGALNLYTIATIMREGEKDAFSTSFIALEGKGIDSVEDLKGKKMAIVDEGSQLDFVARQGLQKGGLDPDKDATFVVLPFPAQEAALRGGQIDLAGLPEPFYTLAMSKGGVKHVYDAADLTDFAYDLLTLSFDKDFVEKNLGAVCAWAADYRKAMQYYTSSKDEAKGKLVGTPFVTLPGPVYLKTGDYARPEDGTVDTDGMQKMMDQMIEFGILTQEDKTDVTKLVRKGVTIGH
jgi:ABC-type nitrate/sulfonate/bicarbonate transport system substrate-binding protein